MAQESCISLKLNGEPSKILAYVRAFLLRENSDEHRRNQTVCEGKLEQTVSTAHRQLLTHSDCVDLALPEMLHLLLQTAKVPTDVFLCT